MRAATIHKYVFDLSTDIEIVIQGYIHRLLSIQKQHGEWCAWVEVRPEKGVTGRLRLIIVGTGHQIPEYAGDYFTTIQDGSWVWHVYASMIGFSTKVKP